MNFKNKENHFSYISNLHSCYLVSFYHLTSSEFNYYNITFECIYFNGNFVQKANLSLLLYLSLQISADLLLILNFVYFEFVENVNRCCVYSQHTDDIEVQARFSAWHRLVSHIGAK